mgnify:CR=1 FL=1
MIHELLGIRVMLCVILQDGVNIELNVFILQLTVIEIVQSVGDVLTSCMSLKWHD